MRPRRGLDSSSVWAQRVRQLEQRLRTKEERIVVLETENAVLHLKLAEYQGLAGRCTSEVLQLYAAHGQQMKFQRSSAVTQLHVAIKRLKQDLKSLHSFALELSKDFQRQSKTCLYQVLAAVQGIQLQNEAMQKQIRELSQDIICSEGGIAFRPLCDRESSCVSTAECLVQHRRGGNKKLWDCQLKEADCKGYSPEYACKASQLLD